MAIPIFLPNSEEAEDSHRLDLLLEQLLITLRQVLIHRRREAAANAPIQTPRHRHFPSEGTAIDETFEQIETPEENTRVSPERPSDSSLPLPDLVLETTDYGIAQEQKESERTRTVERSEMTTATTTPPPPPTTTAAGTTATHNWGQVGADLKRIADQLLATNRLDQKDDKKTKMKDEKDASLLSLLCPPLGSSVWTTVALLVGWGLLTRTR